MGGVAIAGHQEYLNFQRKGQGDGWKMKKAISYQDGLSLVIVALQLARRQTSLEM
jgi:hypothetical protein